MNYFEKLKNPKWQKLRLKILERDEFMCQNCGETETELNVHHLLYEFKKEPWEIDEKYLITFCVDCHNSRHEQEKEIKEIFAEINDVCSMSEIIEILNKIKRKNPYELMLIKNNL